MANIKISELNELEEVDNDDLLVIVDTSSNETKKVKAKNVGTGGGGSEVVIIDDEQPTSEFNKLWIDTGEVGSAASEITNEYSTSVGKGYSADYSNKAFGGVVLYENSTGSNDSITLNDSITNYKYIEIFYGSATRYQTSSKIDLRVNNGGTLTEIHSDNNGAMYFNTRTITISGTTLATDGTRYSSGQSGAWTNWSNTNSIYIYKVIGYK